MTDTANRQAGLLAAASALLLLLTLAGPAQVFGSGPSDPALFTNGVFNVPPDIAPTSVGALQQLNVVAGGSVGDAFDAFDGSEVNISGGIVGSFFTARSGSEVNISGSASVGTDFGAEDRSQVNISGGAFGFGFNALSGSEVNISGGTFSRAFRANSGSEVNISGGNFDNFFNASPGSSVELFGGEFRLNGDPIIGTISTLDATFDTDVLTGTLQDGSAFIFIERIDTLVGVTLTASPLPPLVSNPIIVSTSRPDLPSGLRAGQTLTLRTGGVLGDVFEVVDATLNVAGGDLGSDAAAVRSEVNISSGNVGNGFDAFIGSEVNISGGSVGRNFGANAGSVVNITGGNVGNNFDASFGSVVNISGGTFGQSFRPLSGSQVNISGGTFSGNFFSNPRSVVNISGGTFGVSGFPNAPLAVGTFVASDQSQVSISGGTFVGTVNVSPGSEVNLVGTEFFLNDEPIDGLEPNIPFEILDRALTSSSLILSGTLVDGTAFAFDLNGGIDISNVDFFDPEATLTVTLAPQVAVLDGDYNSDRVVSAADYAVWRDTIGSTTDLQADGNNDQEITISDFDVWSRNFGNTAPLPVESVAAPEPGASGLLLLAGTIIGSMRQRPLSRRPFLATA